MINRAIRALPPGQDAISLLKADHRKVEGLFSDFESAKDKRSKLSIAKQICEELEMHDYLESKIFYPAAKQGAPKSEDEVNEGVVEHEAIRRLVKQIPKMSASDELFESRVTVLIEYVKHHVKEEEKEMFPQIADSKMDLIELGERMAAAKERKLKAARTSPSRRPAARSAASASGASLAR